MINKLNIIVCIKQVPDVDDIKWTKENNLDRSLMLSKINPYDEMALNQAIEIKKNNENVKIKVISMGPNQAKDVLEYALAKGADEAYLLSDKLFSASDTLITSKILKTAITKYLSDFDLIFTGQMAVDGDTQQVPHSLAAMLDINCLSNLTSVNNISSNNIEVTETLCDRINTIKAKSPVLLAFKEDVKKPNPIKIEDYIKGQKKNITYYNAQDLNLNKNEIGIIGSPTMVYRAYRPHNDKNTQTIEDNFVQEILNFINEANK